MGKVIKHNKLY